MNYNIIFGMVVAFSLLTTIQPATPAATPPPAPPLVIDDPPGANGLPTGIPTPSTTSPSDTKGADPTFLGVFVSSPTASPHPYPSPHSSPMGQTSSVTAVAVASTPTDTKHSVATSVGVTPAHSLQRLSVVGGTEVFATASRDLNVASAGASASIQERNRHIVTSQMLAMVNAMKQKNTDTHKELMTDILEFLKSKFESDDKAWQAISNAADQKMGQAAYCPDAVKDIYWFYRLQLADYKGLEEHIRDCILLNIKKVNFELKSLQLQKTKKSYVLKQIDPQQRGNTLNIIYYYSSLAHPDFGRQNSDIQDDELEAAKKKAAELKAAEQAAYDADIAEFGMPGQPPPDCAPWCKTFCCCCYQWWRDLFCCRHC